MLSDLFHPTRPWIERHAATLRGGLRDGSLPGNDLFDLAQR
jgi:hypothetical protein